MMATQEKPTEDSKLEETVMEESEPASEIKSEVEIKTEQQHEMMTEEEQDIKMEMEETQKEESTAIPKVTMETESTQKLNTTEEMLTILVSETSTSPTKDEGATKLEDSNKIQEEQVVGEIPDAKQTVDDNNKLDDNQAETTGMTEPVKEAVEEVPEEWDILRTDDEDETIAGDKKRSGVWMPEVNVIIDLYRKLDKEAVLELTWKCPGRRKPEEEKEIAKDETEKMNQDKEAKEDSEEKLEDEPTEFDFDTDTTSVSSSNMAPRRTPGSAQALGSGKKRVARMDKIFDDMMRHKRIDEELQRVGDEYDDVTRTDTCTTPQRPLGKFRIRKDF